jgi:hypothetical protein
MAPLPPVQHVLKAVINFTINNVPCANVFHISYAGLSPTAAQANQVAQNTHSAWSQNFIPWLLPEMLLLNCMVSDLSDQFGAQGEYTLHIPGAASGTPIPASAALVGSWAINNRYRGGKPRTYISGFSQAQMLDAQHWNPDTVAILQNAFEGFLININGMSTPTQVGPFSLGCVHYRKDHAPLATPYFDKYQSVSVASGIRSQRGRLT